MDYNKRYSGDLAMAFVPAQCRENASILYSEYYRGAEYDVAGATPSQYGYSKKTGPATSDKHVHTAHMDAYGNGSTSFDNGHSHSIRAGLVAPFQDPFGVYAHDHPGLLMEPGSDPDAGEG